MTEQDMSWVESGYISHPATANQFPTDDDSTIVDSNVFNYDDDTIREQPTSLDCIHVGVRDTANSVNSTVSTISLLLGGFTECMQPVKSALSSVKGYFNPYKIDSRDLDVDPERDYYSHGMEGTIMKAKHLGHDVAVKRLLHQKTFNPVLIEKLARIRPRNIILFIGYTMDPPQYIMEFLPHGTLETYVREGRDIAPKLLVRWSGNIVDGLEALHKLNVIHCDLKSANLMLDVRGEELKIIDLESCVVIPEGQDQVPMNRVRGTTPYMCPEMIKQLPCTTMVDIWAFGVILWQMVTLKAPYKGMEEIHVFFGIGRSKISLPIPEDIPDGIKLLLQMCWKQEPEARPVAFYIKKHLEELSKELERTSNETYRQSQMSWREDCEYEYDEYEFDPQEIKEWMRERKSYRTLQMRYSALLTSYNTLYQEFKQVKKDKEPSNDRSFCRKKSSKKKCVCVGVCQCKKKKKAPSKTSLLFSPSNRVELTRTVSAPQMTDQASLNMLNARLCSTPKASTLGTNYKPIDSGQPETDDKNPDYGSPIESDDSRTSQASARHGDIESGADSPDQFNRVQAVKHRRTPKERITSDSDSDSAFELSLSSQLEISDPIQSSSMIFDDDEFGEESLDNFGVQC